jgi:hypothetical protein
MAASHQEMVTPSWYFASGPPKSSNPHGHYYVLKGNGGHADPRLSTGPGEQPQELAELEGKDTGEREREKPRHRLSSRTTESSSRLSKRPISSLLSGRISSK